MYQILTSRIVGCAFLALLLVAAGCAVPKVSQDTLGATAQAQIPAPTQRQYDEALERLQAGDFATADALFEAFVQRYPDYASAYINLAIIHAQQNSNDEAFAMLSRALEIDSTNPVALNQLGLLKRRGGDFAAAEEAWRKAIAANPDYAYAWYNLGVLYDLYLQDLPAALEHYQTYQKLSGGAEADPIVARWIADLKSRIGGQRQTAQAREF